MGDVADGRVKYEKLIPDTDEDLVKNKNAATTTNRKRNSKQQRDDDSEKLLASDRSELSETQNEEGLDFVPPPNSVESDSGTLLEMDTDFDEKIVVHLDLDELTRPPSKQGGKEFDDQDYLETELWCAKEELEKKTLR